MKYFGPQTYREPRSEAVEAFRVMGPEYTARAMGACLRRADLTDRTRPHRPHDEVYWYTRETCFEILKATFPNIVLAKIWTIVCNIEKEYGIRDYLTVCKDSEFAWTEVAHPDLIVQEVHES
jgi:hypothetical protein